MGWAHWNNAVIARLIGVVMVGFEQRSQLRPSHLPYQSPRHPGIVV